MRRVRPGFVYFLRACDGGDVKIGCSQNPAERLSKFARATGRALVLAAVVPGDEDLERRFHALFLDDRTDGEWFGPSERMDAVIAAVACGSFDYACLPEPHWLRPQHRRRGWSEQAKATQRERRAHLKAIRSGASHSTECVSPPHVSVGVGG